MKLKSLLFVMLLGLMTMAFPTSSKAGKDPSKVTLCPGSGSNCLSAQAGGTTIQLYRGAGQPDIIIE